MGAVLIKWLSRVHLTGNDSGDVCAVSEFIGQRRSLANESGKIEMGKEWQPGFEHRTGSHNFGAFVFIQQVEIEMNEWRLQVQVLMHDKMRVRGINPGIQDCPDDIFTIRGKRTHSRIRFDRCN